MTETHWPNLSEADFIIRDFRFASGETLPELRQHYFTFGTPGAPAVLLIHNTTGTAKTWLEPSLADELFGPGQPLDVKRHYVVMVDNLGHGASSKPSDGLRAEFPRYNYEDMVRAQHRLVTEGLGLRRLRLVIGNSMGGLISTMVTSRVPDRVRGVVLLAPALRASAGAGLRIGWNRSTVVTADAAFSREDAQFFVGFNQSY